MSGLTHEEVKRHVRTYWRVFGALAVLTVVTVAVSYLHLATALAILVAVAIATVKASLVAAFFMHLSHEKRIILWVLVLTFVFFLVLLIYPSIDRH
jgi:cytochrome c oxidase subunit 4